ncbi:MAG: hypothetical protein DWI00_06430 [Planctomycetota bacterium]|nr:MAG: hypothetical protein DWI00_06430 [Planctomycetota bacterium]
MNFRRSPFPPSVGLRILLLIVQAPRYQLNRRFPDVRHTTGTANSNARTTNAIRVDENSVVISAQPSDQGLAEKSWHV